MIVIQNTEPVTRRLCQGHVPGYLCAIDEVIEVSPHLFYYLLRESRRLVHGQQNALDLQLRVELCLCRCNAREDLCETFHRVVLTLDRHKDRIAAVEGVGREETDGRGTVYENAVIHICQCSLGSLQAQGAIRR